MSTRQGVSRRPDGAAEDELEDIELEGLLEAIFRYYGFDFRDYSRKSLKRRAMNMIRAENLGSVSALQGHILHNPAGLERFLSVAGIGETSMFRDPALFLAFRRTVVPMLRTYPFLRIWSSGCSAGQEAYSIAILLEEEGLLQRSRIYATDMNAAAVRKAQDGIYPMSEMKAYTHNYFESGGRASFSDYYTAAYDRAILSPALKRHIVFAQHNLATDASFNEFHVVLCRNVLIYFNSSLQQRVLQLIHDSLIVFGWLCLGSHESLRFAPHQADYEQLPGTETIYQRTR